MDLECAVSKVYCLNGQKIIIKLKHDDSLGSKRYARGYML